MEGSNNFLKYVADDCTARAGGALIPVGADGMQQHVMDVRGTCLDLKMTVTRQYSDGGYVITEFLAGGTHRGVMSTFAHIQDSARFSAHK